MTKTSWAINYFSFYIIWCLCIWGAAHDRSSIPLTVIAIYLIVHLAFVSQAPVKEILLIAVVATLGCCNESILAYFGAVSYAGASFLGVAWWTLSLYVCFATTLWYSFAWLIHRPLLSSILSATAMPICYLGMAHARAIAFPSGEFMAFFMVSLQYAVLVPLLGYIATGLQKSSKGEV
jgi:hypothetical protein